MARYNEAITQKKFNRIVIGLASPEVILGKSRGEVLNPKPSTTGPTNPNVMACSVNVFLGPLRIMNVPVENTSVFVTKELYVTVVVWKLPKRRYVVTAWGILTS